MAGIQADYVGRTPEEDYTSRTGNNEYTIYYTMKGCITVYAPNIDDAKERFGEIENEELSEHIEEVEIDEID